MCNGKIIAIGFFLAIAQASFAKEISKSHFKLKAGKRQVLFESSPNKTWKDFCLDRKFGCARVVIKDNPKRPTFGFVRVLTDQLRKEDFSNYCKKVFDLSLKTDKDLANFTTHKGKLSDVVLHCSWEGKKDAVHLFLKDGITFVVNTSDKSKIEKIVNEAIINDRS